MEDHWLADSSHLGMNRSYGIMVNYKYHLPDIPTNANGYINNGHLSVSITVIISTTTTLFVDGSSGH